MTRAYPRVHRPYNPTTWGAAAYPVAPQPVFIAHATEDSLESLEWVQTTIDVMLGANPMNQSWVVGLGDNPVLNPVHVSGWNTYTGIVPPGIQVEGPFNALENSWLTHSHPAFENRPTLYRYVDINYIFPVNEPVVRNMSKTAMMMIAARQDQVETEEP